MSLIKSAEGEIAIMREGGRRRRRLRVVRMACEYVKPGLTTRELDAYIDLAHYGTREISLHSKIINRTGEKPFPAAASYSVNDEIVHGIPGGRIIQEGDVVSIDVGLTHRNLVVDHAKTVAIGEVPKRVLELLQATERSLYAGIDAAKVDGHVGDISAAIEEWQVKHRFGNVRELGGHGVGHKVHEEPYVPNYGRKGTGPQLKEGMVLAAEPMFILDGTEDIRQMPDGYTIMTHSGAYAAHFEHTIVFTRNGVEILTIE